MISEYNPSNWYWRVADDQTKVFSSATGVFVPADDAEYQRWVSEGNVPTPIDSAESLGGVMKTARIRPVDPEVLAAYQAEVGKIPDVVNMPVLLDLENRMRALEGQPARTEAEYRTYLASLV